MSDLESVSGKPLGVGPALPAVPDSDLMHAPDDPWAGSARLVLPGYIAVISPSATSDE
jgi:hypothetical protein